MDICILALEHEADPVPPGDSATTLPSLTPGARSFHPAAVAGAVLADTWVTVWSSSTSSELAIRRLMRKTPQITTCEAHRN